MKRIGQLVCLGVWLSLALPAAADHGGSFPLISHSDNATRGVGLDTDMQQCDGQPVLRARFTLAGRSWIFLYAETTARWLFVELPSGNWTTPLRVWIGHGTDDRIQIDQHIDRPLETVPGGPCSLLFPPSASHTTT